MHGRGRDAMCANKLLGCQWSMLIIEHLELVSMISEGM